MTDRELVDRAREGDAWAIRELHDRHASIVLTVALRITRDSDSARDCAQEAWIRALRFLPTYEGRAPFSAWIRKIAARVSLQMDRTDQRRRRREAVFSGRDDQVVLPSEPRGSLGLEASLHTLPDGMRQILLLHDVEGFTHDEIGEILEIAPGTSKSQLFKARAKLREIVRGCDRSGLPDQDGVVAGEFGRRVVVAKKNRLVEKGG